MSLTVEVKVDDKATPQAFKIRDELSRNDVKRVMGRAIAGVLRAHFHRLDAERANALGGRRTHFYSRATRGVQQPEMVNDGLKVSINQVGISQRIRGGTIVAGQSGSGRKYLTIPARSEAYGKRAREFDNLQVMFNAAGKPVALVERAATRIRRTAKGVFKSAGNVGGGVYFWLVRQVYQKPDPNVLPRDTEMTTPALSSAASYLQRIWDRRAGGTT